MAPALGRREFLKKSALVGGAVVGGLSLARSAHAAGSEVLRIGMVGSGGRCGGAAAESMRAAPFVKLVAMCDLFEDRVARQRNTLKQHLGDQVQVDDEHCFVGFDGYQKVIDSCDLVLIACASKFHPMYAEAAIKAGKHVFVEKPHGIDPEGVKRMQRVCDLAKEKNLSILSGLHSRYHNVYQESIKRIHDGAIGDVVAVQNMFLRAPYRIEVRQPQYTETQYQFSNWYHFCWLSGDDVTQSLVHNMDRTSWVLQEASPKWAFGLGGRSASFGEVYGDMFDHHTVVYHYESGARAYAVCRTQAGCYDNFSDMILGTKGACDLENGRITGENAWKFQGRKNNPYLDEQKALVDAIVAGKPLNSGSYMINSTMIAVMGQIACYTGQEVEWKKVVDSNMRFGPAPEESTFDTAPPCLPDESGNYPLPMPGITKLI